MRETIVGTATLDSTLLFYQRFKSMSTEYIYIPYFYIIQDTRNNKYYAGSKYGKDANPENFMQFRGYTTSSTMINKIIEDLTSDVFIIRKIKTFITGDCAYNYETKFLQKVDARNNPKFYNGHNNDCLLPAYGSEKHKIFMLEKYGVENAFQIPEIKEKIKQTNIEKYGFPYSKMSEKVKETERYNNLEKYGFESILQIPEIREKIKQTNIEKYGVPFPLQNKEVRAKVTSTNLLKYGSKAPAGSPLVMDKMKSTNLLKYGAEYYYQSEESKQKGIINKKKLGSRPIVQEIKLYVLKFNLSIPRGWYQKKTEILEELLKSIQNEHGIILLPL